MSDWRAHHLTATIADTDSSVTLTEGTDYTLQRGTPSDSYAWAFVPANIGAEPDTSEDAGACYVSWSDITTSLTVTRAGTSGAKTVPVIIIEYLGSVGGANEFIVRDHGTISLATTDTGSSGAVADIADDADVVPFLTGVSAASTGWEGTNTRLAWDSVNDEVDATRSSSVGTLVAGYAVVEFVGSNWTIQSGTFTMDTAGSEQTGATITSVTDVENAFLEVGHDKTGSGIDDLGVEVYLSNATTVAYFLESGGATTGTVQFYVIENADLTVSHYVNQTIDADPKSITLNPTVTTTEAAQMGISARSSGTGSSVHRVVHTLEMTSGSNIEVDRTDANQTGTLSFSVVDFSGLDDAGTATSALATANSSAAAG